MALATVHSTRLTAHQKAPELESQDLPPSSPSTRVHLASEVASNIINFSASSSNTASAQKAPKTITVASAETSTTTSIFMQKLFLKIKKDAQHLREMISDHKQPIDRLALFNFRTTLAKVQDHLQALHRLKEEEQDAICESLVEDDAETRVFSVTPFPPEIAHCTKLAAIVDKNLTALSNCLEALSLDKTRTDQTLHFPKRFAHVAWLRATRPITDQKVLGKGITGTVYQVQHAGSTQPQDRYVVKQPSNLETLHEQFRPKNGKDLTSSEHRTLESQLQVISNAQPKTLQKEVLQLFALPRHPNLVEFLGVTETGWPMLEHVLGGELFHAIDNKTLPDSKKYSIAQELANALAAIHRNRQIHSDIKSDNVLLTEDFNAKITDFGYAVFRKEDLPKHTFGTPCYAPPELILYPGRPKDASIDTWCYGYLIFFMLSETLFYDALFHSCYRKYPQHEYGWTVKQVDLFLREEDYRMDAKITETLNTLEHTLQASSLSPDQARTLVSVMRLCLKFKAQERAPMETIEALFAATTIK